MARRFQYSCTTFDCVIHGPQQDAFCALHPGAKNCVAESLRQFAKTIQIESFVRDAKTSLDRVLRVDLLFDVVLHRHHKQRLAEICTLADGFKPSSANHEPTRGHHTEKFFAVEPMKRERAIVTIFGWSTRFVVEAMHLQFGMRLVPANDLLRVTVVQQIDEREFSVRVCLQLK